MKRKNLLSGLLAGALVLTSVFVPGVKNVVNAEEYDLSEGLVASFSFDDENLTDSQGGEDASAIVTGLNPYSGRMEYVDGYDGGKGIQLGDYGLKLNRENLGENFTVSLWIKPDNTIQADQATLFVRPFDLCLQTQITPDRLGHGKSDHQGQHRSPIRPDLRAKQD